MRPALEHAALIQHDDFVGIDNGGQAMRDDKRGAMARNLIQFELNGALGARIERAGGLIENQDGWILEQCSGDGDALLFAAGQFQAAFAHLGLIAVRSEEHTSELQSLMRISYAVFCLKKKTTYKCHHIGLMIK